MADAGAVSPPPATPASGRREQAKAANRAAILDAAREVFGEIGYGAATVRDIVRRTGLSVGAFYNYYRSKEEVYGALADDGAGRFRPRLRAIHDAAPDFGSYVRQAVRAYFDFLVEEHESWSRRRPPGEPRHPTVRAETPEMLAVFEEVKADLAEAVGRGDAAVDADYLAAALIAVARDVGERMLARRPIDVEAAAAFAETIMLKGLGGLPTQARPEPAP